MKFRHKVLETRDRQGLTIAKAATRSGVASVVRWLKSSLPKATRNRKATRIDMSALAQDLREHPDAFQYKRAARFGLSRRGIGEILRRLGVTYKKHLRTPKRAQKDGAPCTPG